MRRRHPELGQGGGEIVGAVVMVALDVEEGVTVAITRCDQGIVDFPDVSSTTVRIGRR